MSGRFSRIFSPVICRNLPFSHVGYTRYLLIETRSVEEFFGVAAGEQVWHSTNEQATARRYRRLVEHLGENLTDAKVYRIGGINLAVLILGRSPAGTLMGLRTRVVET